MSEVSVEQEIGSEKTSVDNVKLLGREALSLIDKVELDSNLASGGSEKINNPELTRESLSEYYKNRANENYNFLKQKNPTMAAYYREIITSLPHLKIIGIADKPIDRNANFSCLRCSVGSKDGNNKYRPDINYNFSNMETYTEPGLESLLKLIALRVGARDEDVLNNTKLVSTFVFLHELGHGEDYIKDYLLPQKDKPIDQAVKDAVTLSQKRRGRDLMTQPIPRRQRQGETKTELYKLFKSRLRAMDINSVDELTYAMGRSYREMSSEKYADEFAEKFIMDHYSDFFMKPGEKNDRSGRITTGEMIEMKEDFADLLGLQSGINISLEKITKNGSSDIDLGHKQTGFIKKKLAINQPILLGDGDVSHGHSMNTTSIRVVYRKKGEDGQNFVFIHTNSDSVYKIIKNDREPSFIPVDAEKLSGDLGIGVGSEIQLMKRVVLADGDSELDEGIIIKGKLQRSIKLGDNISFSNGSQTTTVIGIQKRWKSFFVSTSSKSIYEIIPLE